MAIQIILLIAGFILLIKGASWFVDSASGIAVRAGIPQLVIGLTIVAMGTSLPEAAVSISSTVKGYAEHESGTLEAVVAARAKATQTTVDPSQLTAENIAKFQAAQGELGRALGRLLVTVERYPDLKANQNFLELQAQLEGTENRISTERMKFNETAKSYNTLIRSFPQNIIASIFSFTPKGYFKAAEGSENAPKVEF